MSILQCASTPLLASTQKTRCSKYTLPTNRYTVLVWFVSCSVGVSVLPVSGSPDVSVLLISSSSRSGVVVSRISGDGGGGGSLSSLDRDLVRTLPLVGVGGGVAFSRSAARSIAFSDNPPIDTNVRASSSSPCAAAIAPRLVRRVVGCGVHVSKGCPGGLSETYHIIILYRHYHHYNINITTPGHHPEIRRRKGREGSTRVTTRRDDAIYDVCR